MSFRGLFADLLLNAACRVLTGSGSPESSVTAGIGSLYLRTTAGVGTTLYTKESGTGTTGWSEVGLVKTATVTLTDAQIKALPTTGITIVAAPGSGYRVKPLSATVKAVIVGAYTNINTTYSALEIRHASPWVLLNALVNDNSTTPALTDLTAALTTVQTTIVDLEPLVYTATGYAVAVHAAVVSVENLLVQVKIDNNGSGDLTGGNAGNSLVVRLTYLVEAV